MSEEISVILDYVLTPLYKNLPRRRVDCFAEELEKSLRQKFYQFWSENDNGVVCSLQFNGMEVDPAIRYAAEVSGLGMEEVKRYLPQGLVVWVTKGNVTYSEDGGEVQALLTKTSPVAEEFYPTAAQVDWSIWGKADNGWRQASPSSSQWGAPSPQQTQPQRWRPETAQQSGYNLYQSSKSQAQVFTSAEFAQTKFGSMKLRGQMRKPHRVSPTDLDPPNYSNVFMSPLASPSRSVPDVLPIASQQSFQRQSISPFLPSALSGIYPDISPPASSKPAAPPVLSNGQFPQPDWFQQWSNETSQQLNASVDAAKATEPYNLLPVSLQQVLLAN